MDIHSLIQQIFLSAFICGNISHDPTNLLILELWVYRRVGGPERNKQKYNSSYLHKMPWGKNKSKVRGTGNDWTKILLKLDYFLKLRNSIPNDVLLTGITLL